MSSLSPELQKQNLTFQKLLTFPLKLISKIIFSVFILKMIFILQTPNIGLQGHTLWILSYGHAQIPVLLVNILILRDWS